MKYITLTPFGDHKFYAIREFMDSLNRLNPKPEEKVICADLDTMYKEDLKDFGTILYSPAIFCSSSLLERICSAREILRNYFIHNPKYEWALWIDSDIICPPNTPRVLFEIAKKNNSIMVSNAYPGRNERKWTGSGCMLTHKLACTASRFWVGNLEGKHLSEDFVFLSIIDQAEDFITFFTGKNGRVVGEFVEVKHILKNPGQYEI